NHAKATGDATDPIIVASTPSISTVSCSRLSLQPEVRQSWMIVRPPAERPAELALGLGDRQIVDAGYAPAHQAVLVELPVLIAVRAEPVAGVVVPFVRKAHGDARAVERPQFLDQAIV